ncbi:hypothetical protein NN561_000890 [Cricetulus griseus]
MGCTITFCTFWPWPRYAMVEVTKDHTSREGRLRKRLPEVRPGNGSACGHRRLGLLLGNASLATEPLFLYACNHLRVNCSLKSGSVLRRPLEVDWRCTGASARRLRKSAYPCLGALLRAVPEYRPGSRAASGTLSKIICVPLLFVLGPEAAVSPWFAPITE